MTSLPVSPSSQPQPPHNLEMEAAVLGAVLKNNRCYDAAIEAGLRPEMFHSPEHQRIWGACATLIERGQVVNAVSLRHYFEQDEGLALAGGPTYLFELATNIVAIMNVPHYARMLADLHQLREIIAACGDAIADASAPDLEDPASIIAARAIFRMDVQAAAASKPVSASDAYGDVLDHVSAMMRGERVSGLATNLESLDGLMGGLRRGELSILAGRPSMGKSACALTIARNVAESMPEDGGRVLFLSLEMSAQDLMRRIASDWSSVPLHAIQQGTLSDADYRRLVDATARARSLPLFIDSPGMQTISGLAATARAMKRKYGLALVVVDYLQLLTATREASKQGMVQAVSEMSRGLKQIALTLDVPVLALSQLSRAVEQRDDKRPMLSDLRESGSIEQDADNVLFVYRESYYLERGEPVQRANEKDDAFMDRLQKHRDRLAECRDVVDIIVAKQRQGAVGTVSLGCNLIYQRIRSTAQELRVNL